MKWHNPLFVGKRAQKNIGRIIKGINEGKILLYAYAIVMPKEKIGQLEIIQATGLSQPYYKKHEVEIVGIAGSKDEAIEVVCNITNKAIAKNGEANIRAFLEDKSL